ncbi:MULTISPECIES: ParA family protein [Aeromicrobium]|uniref:ParA family protein n=1 Tax=Aeromicrobium piscarium TaxID=2590901 RepID=A0A554RNI0_9ACTN|nr:ParA family protein [Aeromicrobium piscarium]
MEQTPTAADFARPDFEEDASTPLATQARDHVDLMERLSTVGEFGSPTSSRVFVVANQKGGVGKTTTSVNIAAAMALRGLSVLLIDLDPQGNASTATNIEHGSGTPGTYEVLLDGMAIDDAVQQAPDIPNLTVVPATIDLAGAEIELVSLVSREQRLRQAIDSYVESHDVDYVFIDCPPSLGLLTVNAMAAAREVLIPIQCEYYALEGLSQLLRNIELVQRHLNPDLDVTTVLLTMHDARTNLSASVAAEVRQHFGDRVLQTAIPRSVKISEAPGYQQTILTYDPTSTGALSYLEAAREMTTHYPQKEQ